MVLLSVIVFGSLDRDFTSDGQEETYEFGAAFVVAILGLLLLIVSFVLNVLAYRNQETHTKYFRHHGGRT